MKYVGYAPKTNNDGKYIKKNKHSNLNVHDWILAKQLSGKYVIPNLRQTTNPFNNH